MLVLRMLCLVRCLGEGAEVCCGSEVCEGGDSGRCDGGTSGRLRAFGGDGGGGGVVGSVGKMVF